MKVIKNISARIAAIVVFLLELLVLAPIYYMTYPFVKIHEWIYNNLISIEKLMSWGRKT